MKTAIFALLLMFLPALPADAAAPGRSHVTAVHVSRAPVAAFRFSARRTIVRPRAAIPVVARPALIAPAYFDTMLPGYTAVYAPSIYSDRGASPGEPIRIEQTAGSAEPSVNAWYYCSSSNAYYPGVRNCPEGWRQAGPDPAAFLGALRTR